jgi:hypothetical protein
MCAERHTSSADAHAARVELFLHPDYGVRTTRAAAERLAHDRDMRTQDAAQLQAKLECLRLRGWQTAAAPASLLGRTLSWLVARLMFLEKHGCGYWPARTACVQAVLQLTLASACSKCPGMQRNSSPVHTGAPVLDRQTCLPVVVTDCAVNVIKVNLSLPGLLQVQLGGKFGCIRTSLRRRFQRHRRRARELRALPGPLRRRGHRARRGGAQCAPCTQGCAST